NTLKGMIKKSFTHFDPNGYNQNRLPKCLQKNEAYATKMDQMLNAVEAVFFPGQDKPLTGEERISFVFYFYAVQRLDLMTGDYIQRYPIGGMSTPCKDFFDRGLGQSLMTRIINLVLIHGANIPAKALEYVASSGQFPPLLGKGLAPLLHRYYNACSAIKRMSNLKELSLNPLRQFLNGWTVSAVTPPDEKP
ncbi:MAG: hypothetical protein KDK63_02690, partial [Chlamydiia bacterium]|nr:hypothetical protein [Chlamydiia bacterium]